MTVSGDNSSSRWQEFRGDIARLGWVHTLMLYWNRFSRRYSLRIWFTPYHIVAQPVRTDLPISPRRAATFDVREIAAGEYAPGDHPCPRPPEVIAERYAQGAVCLAIFKGERFAGCLWYVAERYSEDTVRCVFQLPGEDCVWDFDVFVAPEFRLSAAFLALWQAAYRRFEASGVQWSISRISALNPESLNAHRSLGAQRCGWINFVSIGAWQWQFSFSSLHPAWYFFRQGRPAPVFSVARNWQDEPRLLEEGG